MMHPATISDTIVRSITIRAPRSRVWRALADVNEFSEWFGVKAEGAFAPGARVRMTSTIEGFEGEVFHVNVVEMTPETRFAWRWHPGLNPHGVEPDEPMTLVVFELEDLGGSTKVTMTESGFSGISLARRARVFEENQGGWDYQMAALERYAGPRE
jgi:uncharacterized protein YndB with AHSA1/START domain